MEGLKPSKNTVSLVLDKVELQNPFIRQFGKASFALAPYLDQLLSKNDAAMIRAEQRGLKRSHHSLQREIGRFLFGQYHVFLKASDTLEQVKYQVEDARAMVASVGVVVQAVRGQVERAAEADCKWREALA